MQSRLKIFIRLKKTHPHNMVKVVGNWRNKVAVAKIHLSVNFTWFKTYFGRKMMSEFPI